MTTKMPLIDSLWADQHTHDIYKVLNISTLQQVLLLQSTRDQVIFNIKLEEFNRFMIHLKPFYMTIQLMPGKQECIDIILQLLTHNQDGIQIYDWIVQEREDSECGYPYSVVIDVALSAEPVIDHSDLVYHYLESGIEYRVINKRSWESMNNA